MTDSGPLRELAHHAGILPEYIDQSGREHRVTSDATRIALLAAMGIDATTELAARAALDRLRRTARAELIPATRVVRSGSADAGRVTVYLPDGWPSPARWTLRLELESSGDVVETAGESVAQAGVLALSIDVPPPGYHQLQLTLDGALGDRRDTTQSLIVAPARCLTPRDLGDGRPLWGIFANLYTVRSARNWGVGDLSDLRALIAWTGESGGAFVGLNPLHALRNRGGDISPYSPVSRLFRNPLYIAIDAIPELADSAEAQAIVASGECRAELERLRATDRVDYEGVMTLKRRVLQALHGTFLAMHGAGETARGRRFRAYVESQGQALIDFATWTALEEHLTPAGELPRLWHEWPEQFRDPAAAGVADFRSGHAMEVAFACYAQFLLDEQLAAASEDARDAGLAIGVYQDLAIGTSPSGSDSWAFQHLFATGVSLGAPSDAYAAQGQNWGLPPFDPLALARDGYRYWITLVRSALRHAGALRMDHVLGLFRQFWIPSGADGRDGAYVRFPTADLLGIVALESTRAGAVIVGEDLGTVPPAVPPTLEDWGILSSKVMHFERDAEGGYRAAADYQPLSLTTADTHDMVPLAGFWTGRDIEIRRAVGLIASDADEALALRDRALERGALLRRLAEDGILPDATEPASGAELRGAVHAFLCRTPAELVGIALDDLVGETEPVNVPGVGVDQFPSWSRRLRVPVEAYRSSADVRAALRCDRRGAHGRSSR